MKTPAEIMVGINCCYMRPIAHCSGCPYYGETDARGVACSTLLAEDDRALRAELAKEAEELRAKMIERKLIIIKKKENTEK